MRQLKTWYRAMKKPRKKTKNPRKKNIEAQALAANTVENKKKTSFNNNEEQTQLKEKIHINYSKIKEYWILGKWNRLVELDIDLLHSHARKNQIILFISCAYQQLGNNEKTHDCIQIALTWGCSKSEIAKILITGVHNTLGRISALNKNTSKTAQHFNDAVTLDNSKNTHAPGHKRTIRETVKLGLLPQTLDLTQKMHSELQNTGNLNRATLNMLKTELELLQHELVLAQQRHQLYPNKNDNKQTPDETWQDRLSRISVSQLDQDLWALERTDYKRNGFFVEFGATNGVLLSNTFLLEKEFEWKGICAEPNPRFYKELTENRACTVSDDCIGMTTGRKVEFIFADVYGGMKKHKDSDKHGTKRDAYEASGKTSILSTISLNDFLLKYNAPRKIDYMSIDTEGSEYEILKTFPFNDWEIKLFTIEHNFTKSREKIRTLLESHGYQCTETQWDDWFELTPQQANSD